MMPRDRVFDLSDASMPGRPRQQQLGYVQRPMQSGVLAVIRLTWFLDNRPADVTEFQVIEHGQRAYDQLISAVTTALTQGADVLIMSDVDPEDFGLVP
jgi:hypothetical protein